jgi:hypothetical protein
MYIWVTVCEEHEHRTDVRTVGSDKLMSASPVGLELMSASPVGLVCVVVDDDAKIVKCENFVCCQV